MRLIMLLRNLFCRSLALITIASGRVRWAQRRMLKSKNVTAIYFHNPNKQLFTKCIRWLKTQGYAFISVEDLIEIVHGRRTAPERAVWLSFDDGARDLLTSVVPAVRRYSVPVTMFIPSGIIAGNGLFPWLHDNHSEQSRSDIRDAFTLLELQQISQYPEITVGSHTVNHSPTPNLTDEQLLFELEESKRSLESWTGRVVRSFAYPVGQVDGRERNLLAKLGYSLGATTEARLIGEGSDPYLLPRFCVGDNIPFPEAICCMTGVWRPVIDPLIRLLRPLIRSVPVLIGSRRLGGLSSAERACEHPSAAPPGGILSRSDPQV